MQKRVLQGAIEVNSKKFEKELGEKKKELDLLDSAKSKIVNDYKSKMRILRSKGHEIQELIEKVRATGNADKDLVLILKKWEDQNLKMFQQHPADQITEQDIMSGLI